MPTSDKTLMDRIDDLMIALLRNRAGGDQRIGLRSWRIITGVSYAIIYGLIFYSFFANYCPSELVVDYWPLLWVPLGLGLSFLVIRKINLHKEPESLPRWKIICGPIVIIAGTLWFTKIALVYSVPALLNRDIGEPFEAQTIVVRKFRGLVLSDCNTGRGNIVCSKSVQKKVDKGDIVRAGCKTSYGH